MSIQSEIWGFMASLKPGEKDYVPMTPEQIAFQTGLSKDKVHRTLYSLMVGKKVELLRGPNGRSIIGFRVLQEPTRRNGRRKEPKFSERLRLSEPMTLTPDRPKSRGVPTPHLDEYVRAKEKYARLTDELGELVEARFHENPYAEEGLLLRRRLESIEPQLHELRMRAEEAERDLKFLRGRHQADLTKSAIESGATVLHGD